jgi:hypothetical protein
MQCSGWEETITPSPMAEDYEVQVEMLPGTVRLSPGRPKSPNVAIWFFSWSTIRHKATLCNSDGQGLIRTACQRCRRRVFVWPTTPEQGEPEHHSESVATFHYGSEGVGSPATGNRPIRSVPFTYESDMWAYPPYQTRQYPCRIACRAS